VTIRPLAALGYAWATPTTLGSLALFLLPMWVLRQARPGRWRDGAWEWVVRPGSRFWRWYSKKGAWAGTTLGWCILFSPGAAEDAAIALHERRHVSQNLLLGPLFIPLYALLWLGWGYEAHPLERDARGSETDVA
jgi:hypothetical protein